MRTTRRTAARRLATAGAALAAFGLGGVAAALPALAHVTVGVDDAHQGASDAVLTFRVPSERSGTTTVKVQIKMPTRSPLGSVVPLAKPGWTVDTTIVTYPTPITTTDGEITKGISDVTYTATSAAAAIPDDRFDTFQLLVGPIPKDVTTLSFPTVQTYANGQTSAWVEPSPPGSEPEHPAPVLQLLPAAAAADAVEGGAPEVTAAAADEVAAARDTARTARVLGIVGSVLGVLGLAAGAFAVLRTRGPASDRDGGEGAAAGTGTGAAAG